MTLSKHKDKLWLIGFLIGPLFAWLCYAVQKKKWLLALVVLILNVLFWWGGVVYITYMLEFINEHSYSK